MTEAVERAEGASTPGTWFQSIAKKESPLMEELQSEELEELVEEMEGESGAEEALPPAVEGLLEELRPAKLYTSRRRAAKQLGEAGKSNRQIVQALITVAETDASAEVRATAAESLRAPVHQAVLQRYPELGERAQSAAQQATQRRMVLADETDTGQSRLAYRLAACPGRIFSSVQFGNPHRHFVVPT
jgi:hypothetical protein